MDEVQVSTMTRSEEMLKQLVRWLSKIGLTPDAFTLSMSEKRINAMIDSRTLSKEQVKLVDAAAGHSWQEERPFSFKTTANLDSAELVLTPRFKDEPPNPWSIQITFQRWLVRPEVEKESTSDF